MKNLIVVGIILLGIGGVLFYLNKYAWDLRVIYGALMGIGVGLILGGIVGYVSKGSAVKRAQKEKELKRLKKEKEALEKKNALLKENTQNKEPNI